MTAYYNEIDPFAAAWLRELIKAGHIAPGDVDERSIEDVTPDDLRSYTQCHFFAGIGVWSYALRQAGWPDDRPVWTGSCPCQPFSTAGKGGGFADERHLWPAFHHLISQCQPPVVFGEQVASKDGLAWLDLVRADCEASGYAVGAVDLCAASVGAPHIRQRLWWVADSMRGGQPRQGIMGRSSDSEAQGDREEYRAFDAGRSCGMADTNRQTCSGRGVQGPGEGVGASSWATCKRPAGLCKDSRPSPLHGFWRNADWLHCRDGKWRPVESGTFPLAHGLPARVVRLRGYGNAIVPQAAAQFIRAYCQTVNP